MEKDPEKKKQYEKECEEYKPPKIKFMKIDEKSRSPSEIVQNYLFERGIDLPDDMKEEYDIAMNPNMNQKVV